MLLQGDGFRALVLEHLVSTSSYVISLSAFNNRSVSSYRGGDSLQGHWFKATG